MFLLRDLRFVLCSRDLDGITFAKDHGLFVSPTNQRGRKIGSHGNFIKSSVYLG